MQQQKHNSKPLLLKNKQCWKIVHSKKHFTTLKITRKISNFGIVLYANLNRKMKEAYVSASSVSGIDKIQ